MYKAQSRTYMTEYNGIILDCLRDYYIVIYMLLSHDTSFVHTESKFEC